MPPSDRDAACLSDMHEAAFTILEFVAGLCVQQYLADRKLQLAVERLIEIIGEAARGVSQEFKAQHPEIPWNGIIGQRHVLAQDYGAIKQERIWLVASERIPEFITQLKPLLPQSATD